ncbi:MULTISPECIES: hypothetical protein [Pseudoalteromonas]|uniref:hypothetical protein n=1 Tax=Pseudoalteromonas TaxID=53246 RepID=UPI001EF5765C|nr:MULTISPECIES: hypothetical protein [Pseudoalteromonas]MCG7561480.1 hypothetical protein [Pseudoalteromonas sp. McH1-42]MEC4088068.1 hypothetical protein [Pseudoalteromonas rubra]
MLRKARLLSTILVLPLFSAASLASDYVTATPSQVDLNDTVTIDWSNYYLSSKYPNPTYNLYVTKPTGEPKRAYRRGLTTTRDIRGPNTVSGRQTIEIEVCDQNGQNCITNSDGRVSFTVKHGCILSSAGLGYYYYCDGNQITQGIVNNAIAKSKITDFISVKNRLYWKYKLTNGSGTQYAWYTNCRSGGALERVTELIENSDDRIDSFFARHNDGKAEWYFYDSSFNMSFPREAYHSDCR